MRNLPAGPCNIFAARTRWASARVGALLSLILLASMLVPALAVATTTPVLEARLSHDGYDGPTERYLGYDVDIDDGTVVVSDYLTDKAFLFRSNGAGWPMTAEISLPFGRVGSVAIGEGNVAVAPQISSDPARIMPVLAGMPGTATDLDGAGVGVDGDLCATTDLDTMRVYRRTIAGWNEIAMIPWSSIGFFPPSVAVAADTVAVSDASAGSIRLFRVGADDAVTEYQQVPGSLSPYSEPAIALSSDSLVVSADERVDVYERSGDSWVYDMALVASDIPPYAQYGRDVAVDGDTIAVSAPRDMREDSDAVGSVLIFKRSTESWAESTRIWSDTTSGMDGYGNLRGPTFGASLALDGDRLVVGAFQETLQQRWLGAAYVYRLSETGYPTDWMQAPVYLNVTWLDAEQRLLEWRNPQALTGYQVTRVLRRVGQWPTGPDDPRATVVYEGTGTSVQQAAAAPGTAVYYCAYARAANGVWSAATKASETGEPSTVGIPTGDDVVVSLNGVTLTFPKVTQAGSLSVTRYAPSRPAVAGRRWVGGGYCDIHPTAQFVGPVQVALDFDGGDLTRAETASLDHWNGASWDRISSAGPSGGTITGSVSSFSEFAVSESAAATPVVPPVVGTPASSPWSVLLGAVLALGAAVIVRAAGVAAMRGSV